MSIKQKPKQVITTTNQEEYCNFILSKLPSMGYSSNVDETINHLKFEFFNSLFNFSKNEGTNFDPDIMFDMFVEDMREMYYSVAPSLQSLRRSKEDSNAS